MKTFKSTGFSFYISFLAILIATLIYQDIFKKDTCSKVSRTICSVSEENLSCFSLVSQFLKTSKKKIAVKIAEKISAELEGPIKKLKHLNLEGKIAYLEFLGSLHIRSLRLQNKYADLLNHSHDNGIISTEELHELIKRINSEKEWIWLGKNNKIYINPNDDLAEIDDVMALVEKMVHFTNEAEVKKIKKIFFDMEITKNEMNSLKELENNRLTLSETRLSYLYLAYTRTLSSEKQPLALKDIFSAVYAKESNSPYVKQFTIFHNKTKKFRLKEYNNEIKRLKDEGITDEAELDLKAFKYAEPKARLYEDLVYACKAQSPNSNRLAANKRFTKTLVGLSFGFGAGSFVWAHRDEDRTAEWYKRLTFDMTMNVLKVFIGSVISTNPKDIIATKMIKHFFSGSILNIPTAFAYKEIFSHEDQNLEKEYNKILKSKEFKADILELLNYIESENKNRQFTKLLKPIHKNSDLGDQIEDNPENLQELLRESLSNKIYEQRKGDLIQSGDIGIDRFLFDEAWGLNSSVRNITVNLLMYNALCTGELNPKKAYAWALTYFVINRTVFDPLYSNMRRESINQ